jgi:uncharacterized membrane protein YoaK (UPF0700 family)
VTRVEKSAHLTTAVILLAMSSGAVDALSFAGLGAVFASVMTGNLVLLGVAVAQTRLDPALPAATAIAAYVAGVLGAASWLRRADRPLARAPGPGRPEWSLRLRRTLIVVPVAQAAVLAGWLASGGHPGQTVRLLLLAPSAFAMGVQSTGVNTLPLTGAATTYLTGTLTTLTTELATSGVPSAMRRRLSVLAAALAGAVLDAVLLMWARPAAPVLPLAATASVLLVLTLARPRSPGRDRRTGR